MPNNASHVPKDIRYWSCFCGNVLNNFISSLSYSSEFLFWNPVWLLSFSSLCFVTYYYSECSFGKFPVDCDEDLCAGRSCPGYPNAVCRVNRCGGCQYEWYNGVTGNILQCQGKKAKFCIFTCLKYGKKSKNWDNQSLVFQCSNVFYRCWWEDQWFRSWSDCSSMNFQLSLHEEAS